jgi:hypothetical protein
MGSRSKKKHRAKANAASGLKFGYGIHRDTLLCDVPAQYLRWCMDGEFAQGTKEWKLCRDELLRRERLHDRLCYELNAPARVAAKQFKVLTGKQAVTAELLDSVDIGDGVDGSMSPWGVRYPIGWNEMTRGERSAWKKRASVEFQKRPLGQAVPEKTITHVKQKGRRNG